MTGAAWHKFYALVKLLHIIASTVPIDQAHSILVRYSLHHRSGSNVYSLLSQTPSVTGTAWPLVRVYPHKVRLSQQYFLKLEEVKYKSMQTSVNAIVC